MAILPANIYTNERLFVPRAAKNVASRIKSQNANYYKNAYIYTAESVKCLTSIALSDNFETFALLKVGFFDYGEALIKGAVDSIGYTIKHAKLKRRMIKSIQQSENPEETLKAADILLDKHSKLFWDNFFVGGKSNNIIQKNPYNAIYLTFAGISKAVEKFEANSLVKKGMKIFQK